VILENIDLSQFGVLGLWTMVLLYEKFNTTRSLKAAVNNNTTATNRLSGIIEMKKKWKKLILVRKSFEGKLVEYK